ncbi:hypothetical protein JDV02_006570 [Purpureocillium takamizusanense]|uniref:Uncharacterized protein n=1 Tax=Purpureocillium takamizusanense TaxID=2060973 RepID=A0A9Q8QIY2_9HYPO|nr:uncharacterized protein JDV02_006570 [Purpureocillium takamizusanense]UNI20490.1 hypothetical protein JDV02_006570 [Purpureocillium takamizusanense]
MKFSTKAVALLSLAARVLGSDIPADGHEEPIAWEVEVRPDEKVTLPGTVQEVRAQLLERNPDWDTTVAPVLAAREAATSIRSRINRRDGDYFPVIQCGVGQAADIQAYLENHIKYLSSLKGKPINGPGGCGRVSCQHSVGVWWCNEHKKNPLELNSWKALSDGLAALRGSCIKEGSGAAGSLSGYRVIIAGADCGKKG